MPSRGVDRIADRPIIRPGRGRRIVILAGQSNAVGQGWCSSITNPQRINVGNTYSNVTLRQRTAQNRGDPAVFTTDSTGALAAYTSTTNNVSGHSTNLLGSFQSMGRHLDYYGAGQFGIGVFAMGSTDLAGDWNPSGTFPAGTNLFNQLLSFMAACTSTLSGQIAAFVWDQGETDAGDSTKASNYGTNLTAFFAAIRAVYPGIPIIFKQLGSNCTNTFTSTVRAGQVTAQAATTNCTMIDPSDLTLVDGQHFNADSYTALGNRYANAVIGALGLTKPVSWTIDAQGLIGMPATSTEVAAVLTTAGISATAARLYLCQEASGNLTDMLNSKTLTATGTGINYQVSQFEYTRKCVTFTAASSTGVFKSTDAGLPDPATTSWARYFVGFLAHTASGTGVAGSMGSSTSTSIRSTTTGWDIQDGVNVTNGATDPTGQIRPFILMRDVTHSKANAYTDSEKIVGSIGSVTGKQITLGFSAVNVPAGATFYMLEFDGANAELSDAQWGALLTTLNWNNANLGAQARAW